MKGLADAFASRWGVCILVGGCGILAGVEIDFAVNSSTAIPVPDTEPYSSAKI